MITEKRKYVQGGVIADRTRVCDVCGSDIPTGSVGWAYVQETKTQTQKRLLEQQGGRDEFADICLSCWERLKAEVLRPWRDGEENEGDIQEEEIADAEVRPAKVHRTQGRDTAERGTVQHKDYKEKRRR